MKGRCRIYGVELNVIKREKGLWEGKGGESETEREAGG
jgi:hypothetical protein